MYNFYEDLYSGPSLSYITKHRTGNDHYHKNMKKASIRENSDLYYGANWMEEEVKQSFIIAWSYLQTHSYVLYHKVLFFIPGAKLKPTISLLLFHPLKYNLY